MSALIDASEENAVLASLAGLNLSSTTHVHTAAFTVEEQTKEISHLPGAMTKNLFLRDKKHGLFLVTCAFSQEVNMGVLGNMLGLAKSNLRFGDEELLNEKLAVKKGSVSPFAVMNDTAKEVTFCLDKSLLDAEFINAHPLRNDRTTTVTPADLMTFLKAHDHEPTLLDFTTAPAPAPAPAAKSKPAPKPKGEKKEKTNDGKKETGLDLTVTKDGDFPKWYTEVITKAELIDYSDISGCYILRPNSYFVWEQIQRWFDQQINKMGVRNSYFPLFVSKSALETEKDHVEGFAPEVAWVTKSGSSDLAEPIAIRPTSETIMYPFFAKWIRSHRDLPLKLNQWSNVVRWEFKDATPFLRSREFLWQEGHTAHTSYEEAQETVRAALDLYRRVYEELMAVPVIPGYKTENEKFAGGDMTTTVEAYINGSGRAIQGATSHNLGQNFGKMFKIRYEDDKGNSQIPWQTSWGLTTRTIGVMCMVHGDDKGLVMPPRVATLQVIICPIISKDASNDEINAYAERIRSDLLAKDIRVDIDARENYTPGWKYNHWEQKGVPIRIEIGPRDLKNNKARLVRRDTGVKADEPVDSLGSLVPELLETIQSDLFIKAKKGRDEKLVRVTKWEDFVPALNNQCLVLTPWCNDSEWEDKVKAMSRDAALAPGEQEEDTCATSVAAKTLCIPFDQPDLPEGTPCFVSGMPAKVWVLWGRSY
jgi:prolyl-tRNA synthetase